MATTPTVTAPVVDPVLERLAAVRPGRYRVVTCYLKLEPRDRARGKYLIKVKNRLKAVSESLGRLGLTRSVREAVDEDLARLAEYLKATGNLPTTQGLAAFLCGPVGLFEVVPLPKVHRSRVVVDRTPLVRELASLKDEFGIVITVVADRTMAQLYEVTAFGTKKLGVFEAANTRGKRFATHGRRGEGTYGEHTYNNRIRQEKARHYEALGRALFQMQQQRPIQAVVLAGPGKEAGAIESFLHPYVAERVIGTTKLNPKTVTESDVQTATASVREEFERESERRIVKEMTDGVGAGWAVNGLPGTLRRLSRGQVRTLLVDAEASVAGYRCEESGRLAVERRECRGEGEAIPVIDVIDEAIEEALHQHVKVDVVYEPAARRSIEGIAALLRFK